MNVASRVPSRRRAHESSVVSVNASASSCAAGNRSALAAETLREMGYTDVVSLDSGFRGWVEAGGDIQD